MSPWNPWLSQLASPNEREEDVACLVVAPGLVVSFATVGAERMLGVTGGSLIGVTMDQLVPLERRGELKNFEDVLAGGSGRRLRTSLRLADGRRADVGATLSPLVDPLGSVIAVGVRYEPARSSANWVRASLPPARGAQSGGPGAEPAPSLIRDQTASEPRFVPSRPDPGVLARLTQLEGHLRWLEGWLVSSPQVPADQVLSVVVEARELARQCVEALGGHSVAGPIPAPPPLPKL